MSNKENKSKNNTRRIYIRSQRRWQEVPEEVYQEHIRFHDTYRHRMQDRGLCCCPRNKWWVCDADCLTCEYRNADVIRCWRIRKSRSSSPVQISWSLG